MDAGATDPASQAAFRAALLDPALPPPRGLRDGRGRPAGRRFGVYRNNVAVALTEALEQAFPVVARLVGDAFFRAAAGVFVRAHPPASPLMMLYGAEFPAFLAGFAPAAKLPYLADVARLEQALREAYHAADAAPVDAAALDLAPSALVAARLRFAPAVRLIRSRHPVHGIWHANAGGGPRPLPGPEDVLVTRPGFDPVVTRIEAGGALLERLLAGDTVGAAAAGHDGDVALGPLFSTLLTHGAITAIEGDRP